VPIPSNSLPRSRGQAGPVRQVALSIPDKDKIWYCKSNAWTRLGGPLSTLSGHTVGRIEPASNTRTFLSETVTNIGQQQQCSNSMAVI
jgi:hypothetical protein